MRHLQLTENAPARPFSLTMAEAEALATAELAVVTRAPGSKNWEVAAGRKVGVAWVGDLQVTVHPKIPIDRLIFMMGYAQKPQFWRNQTVHLDRHTDLAEALAHSFSRFASKALDQGLLQGYQSVDDALPVLRGRVRVADQISRRFGLGLPLEVQYDEFTVDIAENQLLLAATTRLLRMPYISTAIRPLLRRLRLQLTSVAPLVRGQDRPRWNSSRLNARYQAALHLADLILTGNSFEQQVGDLAVSGFVFDMWKIFEDFVCVALGEALKVVGGWSTLQHKMHLDDARNVAMRPDFVWLDNEVPAAVVDAKYKAEKPSGFPQADLYQVLAYCTVLGLSEGHLVYAKGNEKPQAHSVVGSGVTIHGHTLDLAKSPEEILKQVAALAQQITLSDNKDLWDSNGSARHDLTQSTATRRTTVR